MGPCRVSIVYDQSTATFFSGQILAGHVLVECDKEIKINDVVVRVNGVARVDWTEKNNDQCYSNYEEFINARLSIYKEDDKEVFERRFPFTFQLPASLPSTFISPFGFVHYHCKATVQTTEINCLTMTSKIKVQEPFNIINDIDVNSFPHMNKEASVCQSKRLPLICCLSRGTLTVSLSVKKCAFVIGESVSVDYSITNRSSVHLVLFPLALVQKLLYTADSGKKKSDNRNVSNSQNSIEIPPHKDGHGHVTLSVPSVPPNTLGACKCIAVSYYTQLCLGEISGCNPTKFYFEMSLPVVIGTTSSINSRRRDVTIF